MVTGHHNVHNVIAVDAIRMSKSYRVFLDHDRNQGNSREREKTSCSKSSRVQLHRLQSIVT